MKRPACVRFLKKRADFPAKDADVKKLRQLYSDVLRPLIEGYMEIQDVKAQRMMWRKPPRN